MIHIDILVYWYQVCNTVTLLQVHSKIHVGGGGIDRVDSGGQRSTGTIGSCHCVPLSAFYVYMYTELIS